MDGLPNACLGSRAGALKRPGLVQFPSQVAFWPIVVPHSWRRPPQLSKSVPALAHPAFRVPSTLDTGNWTLRRARFAPALLQRRVFIVGLGFCFVNHNSQSRNSRRPTFPQLTAIFTDEQLPLSPQVVGAPVGIQKRLPTSRLASGRLSGAKAECQFRNSDC